MLVILLVGLIAQGSPAQANSPDSTKPSFETLLAPRAPRPITEADLVLRVDGVMIDAREIQRALVYSLGVYLLETRKLALAVETELGWRAEAELRAETGAIQHPPEAITARIENLREPLRPSRSDLEREVEHDLRVVAYDYPNFAADAVLAYRYGDPSWYARVIPARVLFDRVFLPADPALWPVTTIEAARADSGEMLIDDARTSYASRLAIAQKSGVELPRENYIHEGMMRDIVCDAVLGTLVWRTAAEGLSLDLVAQAVRPDGSVAAQWTTAEVWSEAALGLAVEEVQAAKLALVSLHVARSRLAHAGVLPSLDEVRAELDRRGGGSGRDLVPEWMGEVGTHSFEAFVEYEQVRLGFERLVAGSGESNPALAARVRACRALAEAILRDRKVSAEVLFVRAYDRLSARWLLGSWEAAEKEANAIAADLASASVPESDAFWQRLLDKHNAGWLLPNAHHGFMRGLAREGLGRLGAEPHQTIARLLDESEWTRFATGESVADRILTQGPGPAQGPWRGTLGFYFTSVRSVGPDAHHGRDEKIPSLSLRLALAEWTAEQVAAARVEGL